MAVREIKTSISLDGEKAFRQAVNDASRAMRVMNAELKAIGAEFGVTGDKQQFLTQKSNNLRQAIAQQEQIVNALSGAVSDSAQKYGDAARQTDVYRIRLANATAALNRMKQELAATDREAEELGRDSTRVGRQIEDGIGDGAREAQESLSDMMRQMQEDIGSIKRCLYGDYPDRGRHRGCGEQSRRVRGKQQGLPAANGVSGRIGA